MRNNFEAYDPAIHGEPVVCPRVNHSLLWYLGVGVAIVVVSAIVFFIILGGFSGLVRSFSLPMEQWELVWLNGLHHIPPHFFSRIFSLFCMLVGICAILTGIIKRLRIKRHHSLLNELSQNGRVTTAIITSVTQTFETFSRSKIVYDGQGWFYKYRVKYSYTCHDSKEHKDYGHTISVRVKSLRTHVKTDENTVTRGEIIGNSATDLECLFLAANVNCIPAGRPMDFVLRIRENHDLIKLGGKRVRIVYNKRGSLILGFLTDVKYSRKS